MKVSSRFILANSKANRGALHLIDKVTGTTRWSDEVDSRATDLDIAPDESFVWYGTDGGNMRSAAFTIDGLPVIQFARSGHAGGIRMDAGISRTPTSTRVSLKADPMRSLIRIFVSSFFALALSQPVAAAPGQRFAGLVLPPADRAESVTLGAITLTTYTTVTMSPLENSTNLYFTARNQGAQPLTLEVPWPTLSNAKPSWVTHFYKFFGFEGVGSPATIRVEAGQTRTFTFYVSKESAVPPREDRIPFSFRLVETGERATINVTLVGDDRLDLFRVKSAAISGRITAGGRPISGALVSVALFTESSHASTRTDADGRYRIDVLSADDIRTTLGPRPLPYKSTDYFLTVEADGYALAYRSGIAPSTGQAAVADVTLLPATQLSYSLVGELATDGKMSYWWMRFAGSGDRIVAVQGQHSEDPLTGHIIAVDLAGKELWRVPTGAQCWGFDVSPDGRTIAAGCHDQYLYIVSDDGRLLRKLKLGDRPGDGRILSVRFSPDGKALVVDGTGTPAVGVISGGGFAVIDVQTGQTMWKSAIPVAGDEVPRAYKSRWSPDGKRIVAANFGPLQVYTADGTLLWRTNIGESPLWLEMDSAYNVYAAGKSRELWSWDKDGNLRWSYRIAHTSNAAGPGITTDASFMVIPTFNGLLQAFDGQGGVAWQRFMPTFSVPGPPGAPASTFIYGPGHNALSMTPSGNLITVGSRAYQLLLYDRGGTLLWSHQASARASFQGPQPQYPGANSTAISPDGKFIVAGYADSVIRIFAATNVGAPSGLTASSSGSSVTLTWSAPTTGTAPDTYVIEAGSESGLADLDSFSTGTAATSFSAGGIAAGTYFVRVRAGSASGTSAPSNEAVLVVGGGACTAVPTAPANLSVVSVSGGTVVLSWTAAAGNPTTYVVEAGSSAGGANLANIDLGSPATSFTAPGVAGGTYYVRMRGRNACGVGSPSNEVVVTVQ